MSESEDRELRWEGTFNVRDLGGLPTADGRVTRRGALVRADALDRLTSRGWDALAGHGVRTIVDLRNDDELGRDAAPRPANLETLHLPLDASEDREFWDVWASGPQFGTPLYYGPHLSRFPERSARVLGAIADAGPGGVAFHCQGGRDRTGQISLLLLALVGVPAEVIAADYALSRTRLPASFAARGEPDQGPLLQEFLERQGTTAEALIIGLLAELDVEGLLRGAGVTAAQLAALRRRLVA